MFRSLSHSCIDLQAQMAYCTSWQQADKYVGSYRCICGTVVNTYFDDGSGAFFVDFSFDRSSFYIVSFEYTWEGLEGNCVQVCGTIRPYNGRPQIKNPSQLLECEQLSACCAPLPGPLLLRIGGRRLTRTR
jgi:hypothetical protein